MICGNCGKHVQLNEKGQPVSHYWKGSPTFVEEAYCSAQCSLDKYELLGDALKAIDADKNMTPAQVEDWAERLAMDICHEPN